MLIEHVHGLHMRKKSSRANYNIIHYFLYCPILFCAILNILFKMFSKGQKNLVKIPQNWSLLVLFENGVIKCDWSVPGF